MFEKKNIYNLIVNMFKFPRFTIILPLVDKLFVFPFIGLELQKHEKFSNRYWVAFCWFGSKSNQIE